VRGARGGRRARDRQARGRGTFVICDVKPVGKAKGVKGYCKYCYRTHRSWWLMPKEEYPAPEYGDADTRAFLCGYCEHVSLSCYMNIEEGA
jgi:hypothetical protein